jgi:hypothetical protein
VPAPVPAPVPSAVPSAVPASGTWMLKNTSSWTAVHPIAAHSLNTARAAGLPVCQYTLPAPPVSFSYTVDMRTMVQTNTQSGVQRQLMWQPLSPSSPAPTSAGAAQGKPASAAQTSVVGAAGAAQASASELFTFPPIEPTDWAAVEGPGDSGGGSGGGGGGGSGSVPERRPEVVLLSQDSQLFLDVARRFHETMDKDTFRITRVYHVQVCFVQGSRRLIAFAFPQCCCVELRANFPFLCSLAE